MASVQELGAQYLVEAARLRDSARELRFMITELREKMSNGDKMPNVLVKLENELAMIEQMQGEALVTGRYLSNYYGMQHPERPTFQRLQENLFAWDT